MKRCKFLLSVVTFVALLGAAGYFYAANTFEGTLVVGIGSQERVAVASHGYPNSHAPGMARAPVSAIPFEDLEIGREYFSQVRHPEYVQLPFSLRADKAYIPPSTNKLSISEGQDKKSVDIEAGGKVAVGGGQYTVISIGKWSGLMRDPQGTPMAAVTLSGDGGDKTPMAVLLSSHIWQMTSGGCALCFRWHATREEAAQALAGSVPGLETARWGVVDGGAVDWFQSFTPGTGALLKTGEEVTLVAFDEKKPAVAVEIRKGGEKQVTWVAANQPVEGVPIRFDYPAAAAHVFVIDAWEDGKALVTEYQKGQRVEQKTLSQRQCLYVGSSSFNFRLDDVVSTAVAVTESKSTLWAVVLRDESGEEVVLREGESRSIGDARVEYVRTIPYSEIACTFTIDGKRQVTLKSADVLHIGNWRLSPRFSDDKAKTFLDVQYLPGRRKAKVLAIIGVAALLLRLAMQRRWRGKGQQGMLR